MITKAEAEKEVLRLWRALPVSQRQTLEQVIAFAATLEGRVSFPTLGNPRRIITAWLVQEYETNAARQNASSVTSKGNTERATPA